MKSSRLFKIKGKSTLDQSSFDSLVTLEEQLAQGNATRQAIEQLTSIFLVSLQGDHRLQHQDEKPSEGLFRAETQEHPAV